VSSGLSINGLHVNVLVQGQVGCMQTMTQLPGVHGSPSARTAFCATWMSASCDSLLSVSTAFKLGLLTFRSANVKGTACLQKHEAVSQEGRMAITTDASGLLVYKGILPDGTGSVTGARRHDPMQYCSASSHF